MKYIPNILTGFRLVLVPFFPIIYFSDLPEGKIIALFIFLLAGATDVADGYLARKYKVVSTFGIVFDPLADKLMLMASLITIYFDNLIPFFILLLFILKEIFMIIMGTLLYFKKDKTVIPSNQFGKFGTVFFFIALLYSVLGDVKWISLGLFTIALGLKLTAFITYLRYYLAQKTLQKG